MENQTEIPGLKPMSCEVAPTKAHQIIFDTGAYAALATAKDELEKFQNLHPGVAGLTMAIAVVARLAAEKQLESSRLVLISAANAGMPIEHHAIALDFADTGLRLVATGNQTS